MDIIECRFACLRGHQGRADLSYKDVALCINDEIIAESLLALIRVYMKGDKHGVLVYLWRPRKECLQRLAENASSISS